MTKCLSIQSLRKPWELRNSKGSTILFKTSSRNTFLGSSQLHGLQLSTEGSLVNRDLGTNFQSPSQADSLELKFLQCAKTKKQGKGFLVESRSEKHRLLMSAASQGALRMPKSRRTAWRPGDQLRLPWKESDNKHVHE